MPNPARIGVPRRVLPFLPSPPTFGCVSIESRPKKDTQTIFIFIFF